MNLDQRSSRTSPRIVGTGWWSGGRSWGKTSSVTNQLSQSLIQRSLYQKLSATRVLRHTKLMPCLIPGAPFQDLICWLRPRALEQGRNDPRRIVLRERIGLRVVQDQQRLRSDLRGSLKQRIRKD